jgi:hypothetical protein
MKLIAKIISLILVFVLPFIILTNCHSTSKISREEASIRNQGKDFDKFYDKFHKDSLFQVSRIKFPLGGMYVDGITKTRWTRDNLLMMKTKIYEIDTTKYKRTFKKTKNSFTQKVWIEDSGFRSECRFELIDKKWYLVYVYDQNL